MMRRVLFAIAALAVAGFSTLRAQMPVPDLSGRWVLADGATRGAFGNEFKAVQDRASLTLEYGSTEFDFVTGSGTARDSIRPGPTVRVTYSLDGLDTAKGPALAATSTREPPSLFGMTSEIVATVSRAAWLGDRLVIVTHNLSHVRQPWRSPNDYDLSQTIRYTFTLQAAERLVIDRVIIADPIPGGLPTRTDPPGTWTTTYQKSK